MKVKLRNLTTFITENRVTVSVCVLLFIFALFLRAWRLSFAPDIVGAEVLYTQITVNLPLYGQLMAFGKAWFVHPPLFYLLQSVFFQSVGISEVNLTNIYTARLMACLLSSLTIAVIFIWITKVSNFKVASAATLLLIFEPYALKWSRIGLQESMVILFIVTSLYLFGKAEDNGSFKRYILAGVFFGLALLTKELAFYLLLPIAVWWLLTRYISKVKVSIRRISAFIGTALLMYIGYVIWGLSVDAPAFLNTKSVLIQRAFWIIRDTGYTHPRYTSFMTDFLETADIYIVTYILLVLAPVACIYLIFRERSRSSILLSSWFIGSAIFFGSIGIRNPQFFTYITVPAAVIVGYTLSKLRFKIPARLGWKHKKVSLYLVTGILAVLTLYNVGVWHSLYGVGTDDAFSQPILWVRENIPKGVMIVTQPAYSHLLKEYTILDFEHFNTLEQIRGLNIQYFILSPRYTYVMEPDMLEYVLTEGRLVASFYGRSLREVNVYYISHPI